MIKAGIVGYGNLGKGVLEAISLASDIECVGIFTRRDPSSVKTTIETKVYPISELKNFKGSIDVLYLCGGKCDGPSRNDCGISCGL